MKTCKEDRGFAGNPGPGSAKPGPNRGRAVCRAQARAGVGPMDGPSKRQPVTKAVTRPAGARARGRAGGQPAGRAAGRASGWAAGRGAGVRTGGLMEGGGGCISCSGHRTTAGVLQIVLDLFRFLLDLAVVLHLLFFLRKALPLPSSPRLTRIQTGNTTSAENCCFLTFLVSSLSLWIVHVSNIAHPSP